MTETKINGNGKPIIAIDKELAVAIKLIKKMSSSPGGFVASMSLGDNGSKKSVGIFEVPREALLSAYHLMIVFEDFLPRGSLNDKVVRYLLGCDGWVSAKVIYGANGFPKMSKDTWRDLLEGMADQGLLEREKSGGIYRYHVPDPIKDLIGVVDDALGSEMSQALAATA